MPIYIKDKKTDTQKVNKQKSLVKIRDLYWLFVWAERDTSYIITKVTKYCLFW